LCAKQVETNKTNFDEYGYHFAHGCPCGGGRQATHNKVRDSVYEMLRSAGKIVDREVTLDSLPSLADTQLIAANNAANMGAADPLFNPATVFDVEEVSRPLRPDVVMYDSPLTVFEISVTNPCQGVLIDAVATSPDSTTRNSAENRETAKTIKYGIANCTDGTRRVLIPFIVEFFGRMNPAAYKYIRDLSLSCPQGGKGQAGASLRMFWFRNISCNLQRMHAISFKRNLSIARAEFKPSKHSLHDVEDIGYVKTGFLGFGRGE
jgi:hypothetical protein